MKIDFDPQKNVKKFDYFLVQFSRIPDFWVIYNIVKNWPDVLLFRLGLKKQFTMMLRNGLKAEINKLQDYFDFWDAEQGQRALFKQAGLDKRIKVDKNKRAIKFEFAHKEIFFVFDSHKQFFNTSLLIKEQFIKRQYNWLNVKDKDVIDIGANIGDTAIYFALKGAKHVYAFEPYPYSYKIALKNIKLNKLDDKITLLNEGCSGKESSIQIDPSYKNMGGTDLKTFSKGKRIKVTTLESIIKRFNIKHTAILKIDCEGCEYNVLLEAQDSDLRKFKQIQLEYHYGYLNLKKKLEKAGFRVARTIPNQYLGLIYATRKDMY